MQCPTCACKLDRILIQDCSVDQCACCGGVWVDADELGNLIRAVPPSELQDLAARSEHADLSCGGCHQPMLHFEYAHDSGVILSRCETCAGVWLAAGGLEAIARYRRATPAIALLAEAKGQEIRRTNRLERVRELIRSWPISGFVVVAYLVFIGVVTGSSEAVFRTILALLFPLGCIWFCDGFGSLRGMGWPKVTQETPGDWVAIGGWLAILAFISAPLVIWTIIRWG